MKICVKLFSMLKLQFGLSAIELETDSPVSMRELVDLAGVKLGDSLKEKLLDGDEIRKGTLLLVDGRNVLLMNGLDTLVDGNNVISFFPPAGGG